MLITLYGNGLFSMHCVLRVHLGLCYMCLGMHIIHREQQHCLSMVFVVRIRVLELSTEIDRETPIPRCGSETMASLICDSLAYRTLCKGGKQGAIEIEGED